MLRQSADILADAHRIVIKDNDDPVFSVPHIIYRFVSGTSGHRTVTDYSDHMIIFIIELVGSGDTYCSRYGSRAVSRIENVIWAFGSSRKTRDTVFFPQRIKSFKPACQKLICITLVTYVKDDLVFACGLIVALILSWNVDVSDQGEINKPADTKYEVEGIDNNTEEVIDADQNLEEMGTVYRDPETGKYYVVED